MTADNNYRGTGRRKCAIATVVLVPGEGRVSVNHRTIKDYFGNRAALEMVIYQPLVLTQNETKFDIKAKVKGGGVSAQADALRLAISRALLSINEENKPVLRTEGLLTRDSRIKERKKYGRKRARKRFQFSKR